MIKLSNLVLDEIKLSIKEKSILVKGLSTDSRSVRKGYLFAVLTNNTNLYISTVSLFREFWWMEI